ncbi:hypothetical protein [Mesorhizobium sp. M0898]|uniref:hypothetical protein n=1 Tax=Mesorhizobium sp. M0898 TaxID=2957020 RepID=UPI00333A3AF4
MPIIACNAWIACEEAQALRNEAGSFSTFGQRHNVDWFTRRKPFSGAAKSAFPFSMLTTMAEEELTPFVDDTYRTTSRHLISDGAVIYIPYRLHFLPSVREHHLGFSFPLHCLLTRSTDGFLRQKSAKVILSLNESWSIAFVVLLLGEYVVEIAEDIYAAVPDLDASAYASFVRQNRDVMRAMRSKATSYWNAYYRRAYPNRKSYPAIAVLNQLDAWAS